jgi:hypothetical protein
LFIANTTRYSDYGPDGALLAANLAAGAAVTGTAPNRAMYRAVSTYSLVVTGSESANTQRLGVQRIRVYAIKVIGGAETFDLTNTATAPVYETTVFYTAAGV